MPIFVQALKESWKGLIAWAVALIAIMTLYLSFYSTMDAGEGMQIFIDQLPSTMVAAFGFGDIGTGAGWAHSTFFGLLGLFVLAAVCVAWGARAIAGDEENGMLELTLAHRVSRSQVYFERLGALVVRLAVLGLVVAGCLMLLDGPNELGLDFANIAPQVLAWAGVGLLCGTLALAVGAITGRRNHAVTAGAGVVVAAYLLNALGNVSADNDWMHLVSPVSWAYQNRPLLNGWDWQGLALLYGVSALFVAAGWLVFTRRDVTA